MSENNGFTNWTVSKNILNVMIAKQYSIDGTRYDILISKNQVLQIYHLKSLFIKTHGSELCGQGK